MTANTDTRLTVEDSTVPRRRDGAGDILGIDVEGYAHYWHTRTQTVTVVADDEIVHEEHLGRVPLSKWVEYVANERAGWECLPGYSERSLVEMVEVRDDE
jgi:hypothetical protein